MEQKSVLSLLLCQTAITHERLFAFFLPHRGYHKNRCPTLLLLLYENDTQQYSAVNVADDGS